MVDMSKCIMSLHHLVQAVQLVSVMVFLEEPQIDDSYSKQHDQHVPDNIDNPSEYQDQVQ